MLGAGAIFFLASQTITAQIKQSDSTKTKELEEVVLLGVTKKKTSEMVGNSVQLSNKDVSSPVNLSLDQALQGKAPGVMITTTSGTPGSQQSVIIRGVGSIGTSTSPLYVIDGVPVVTGNVSGTKGSVSIYLGEYQCEGYRECHSTERCFGNGSLWCERV